MSSPKGSALPLLSPYRINIIKARKQKQEIKQLINRKEESTLFKQKNSQRPKLFPTSLSQRTIETRAEYFESMKNASIFKRNRAEPTSLTVAYISECQKKNLSPIPIGMAKGIGSSVDIKNYSMGDNYAEAFSYGLKHVQSLEKLNINTNSLSPRGTNSVISNINLQPIKELSLINNQMDHKTMNVLLSLILKPLPTLKYLNLENTGLSDRDAVALCDALTNDRTLTFLCLAGNSLGLQAGKGIKEMLKENHYLKKLDLHWNNLKSAGALLIFEGLCNNASLKELDISWNSIGKSSNIGLIKSISNCLIELQGLAHIDLSFNYLTMQECSILNEGLIHNHDILGIHIVGNEGVVDSQGFLSPSFDPIQLEDSHLFTRIFQECKKPKKYLISMCWICEKWVEVSFVLSSGEDFTAPSFIHIDCDDFQAQAMKGDAGRYEIKRVVPPGPVYFFFSRNGVLLKSEEYALIPLKRSVSQLMAYSETLSVSMSVDHGHMIEASGAPCDMKIPFETIPRKPKYDFNPQAFKHSRIVWSLAVSIFKDYKLLDQELAVQCLEFDWKESRLDLMLKALSDQEALKEVLASNYIQIIETFKYLCTQSGNEYPSIGSNVFTELLNQGEFFDALYEPSDLGVNWSSVIVPKIKQPYNPGNALVRYEFTEILVRVAYDRYVRNKLCKTISEGFKIFLKDNLLKILRLHDSHAWRQGIYLVEEIDIMLKAFKPILECVYKIYSGRKTLPGQKPFMCIEEFRQLCIDAELVNTNIPIRELDVCFYMAMMVQVDELFEKKHMEMSFVEFLEAFCRVCYYCTEDSYNEAGGKEGLDFQKQVEADLKVLIKLCPKQTQDSFVLPNEQTYASLMYKTEKLDVF